MRILAVTRHLLVAPVVLAVAVATAGGLPVTAASAATSTCTVSAKLVNSCRPWVGAAVSNYPGISGTRDLMEDHERRIGRRLDVIHTYHPVGSLPLSADEVYLATRPATTLLVNWRPAEPWIDGAGGNRTVNAQIDQVARNVKAIAPSKIILILHGEPERFATPGTSSCSGLKGTYGSPADFVKMWHNVRSRFVAAGTLNVVWALNLMGLPNWDCLYPAFWPGNNQVDWVMWDTYAHTTVTWNTMVGRFYSRLTSDSTADHAYTSKPWGLAEFGGNHTIDQPHTYQLYDDGRATIAANTFPRVKLYSVFDSGTTSRIAYAADGTYDPVEQQHYAALANAPSLTGT